MGTEIPTDNLKDYSRFGRAGFLQKGGLVEEGAKIIVTVLSPPLIESKMSSPPKKIL